MGPYVDLYYVGDSVVDFVNEYDWRCFEISYAVAVVVFVVVGSFSALIGTEVDYAIVVTVAVAVPVAASEILEIEVVIEAVFVIGEQSAFDVVINFAIAVAVVVAFVVVDFVVVAADGAANFHA